MTLLDAFHPSVSSTAVFSPLHLGRKRCNSKKQCSSEKAVLVGKLHAAVFVSQTVCRRLLHAVWLGATLRKGNSIELFDL